MAETYWKFTVGGGYGDFYAEGTEGQAEAMRRHKATWEAAVCRKEPIAEADLPAGRKVLDLTRTLGEGDA